jgi:hypothetical protein
MMIDRTRLAGADAYFRDGSGNLNLATTLPSAARTAPPGQGRQIDVQGIELYFEGADLWQYFQRQMNPLIRIRVMKEVFPGLFADPFRVRVHTLAGFNDFNAGTFTNCRALEVEGEPTLVSLDAGPCRWTSARYKLPHPMTFVQAAWSLASARPSPSDMFTYTLQVQGSDSSGAALNVPPISFGSRHERSAPVIVRGVSEFQIDFQAEMETDGYFHEHHGSLGTAAAGRPLLRGFHWLEAVECQHDFFSFSELLGLASGYDLLGAADAPLTRFALTIRVPAALVSGPNEDLVAGVYEYIGIEVDPIGALAGGELTYLSARLDAQIMVRPPVAAGV